MPGWLGVAVVVDYTLLVVAQDVDVHFERPVLSVSQVSTQPDSRSSAVAELCDDLVVLSDDLTDAH